MRGHSIVQTGIAALFLLTGASAATAQSVETPTKSTAISYSATAMHRLPGQQETSGKIVKSGQNIRLEFDQNGKSVIQIFRPVDGLAYSLNPRDKTYVEIRTTPVPASEINSYTTPCPEPAKMARCEQIGADTVSGIAVERWAIARKPQSRPMIVLWDSTRKRALRQQFPDGSVMTMRFQAMEDLNGRPTEHWNTKLSTPNQPANIGSWWFDPELRLVVREALPSGELRWLENITTGAVEDAVFSPPDGWIKQDATPPIPAPAPANE